MLDTLALIILTCMAVLMVVVTAAVVGMALYVCIDWLATNIPTLYRKIFGKDWSNRG